MYILRLPKREIAGSLSSVYFCGGDCVEDVTSHLMPHLSLHPTIRTCSSDTIQYELNSIITEKWEGKAYRLVIQRERRLDGEQDLWEGEYTYRCILTNDYTSTNREIVEFYNLRGGKERIFDDMNNGFGWARLPKSFMAENTVFLMLTAIIRRSALPLALARTSTSSSLAGLTRKPSD